MAGRSVHALAQDCASSPFASNKLPLIIRFLFPNLRFFPLLLQIGLCLPQTRKFVKIDSTNRV